MRLKSDTICCMRDMNTSDYDSLVSVVHMEQRHQQNNLRLLE